MSNKAIIFESDKYDIRIESQRIQYIEVLGEKSIDIVENVASYHIRINTNSEIYDCVVSDSLLKILENYEKVHGADLRRNGRQYVVTLVVNTHLNLIRKHTRRTQLLEEVQCRSNISRVFEGLNNHSSSTDFLDKYDLEHVLKLLSMEEQVLLNHLHNSEKTDIEYLKIKLGCSQAGVYRKIKALKNKIKELK